MANRLSYDEQEPRVCGCTSQVRQLRIGARGEWIRAKDGDDTARSIFDNHYSRRRYKDGRNPLLFVGPGEKLVLITADALALFVWRKFRSRDNQVGVNCAVFRNEGPVLSSELIIKAGRIAWERWPGERLYTYVDPAKTRRKRDPGRCFLKAGWKHWGYSKRGLRILDHTVNPLTQACEGGDIRG